MFCFRGCYNNFFVSKDAFALTSFIHLLENSKRVKRTRRTHLNFKKDCLYMTEGGHICDLP